MTKQLTFGELHLILDPGLPARVKTSVSLSYRRGMARSKT
jgi:hypothetical protein